MIKLFLETGSRNRTVAACGVWRRCLRWFSSSLCLAVLGLLVFGSGSAQAEQEAANSNTVFVVKDLASGEETARGPGAQERHPPFSSFKIPNFVIALETEAISGTDQPIAYSPARRPAQPWWPSDWAQDQTLESAFRRSTAWAFQDLALKIGEPTYQRYLRDFAYGNELHQGDAFWLDRSLQISPLEQVHFLERLVTGRLGLSPASVEGLRRAALYKDKDGLRLYGKTGAGPLREGDFSGEFEGWFVGWLERPESAPVVFALWTQGESFEAIKSYRAVESQRLLRELGYLPADW